MRAVGAELQAAELDAVVVVGDDQAELFTKDSMPAIAIYWGEEIADIPRDMTDVPESRAAAMWAKHAQVREEEWREEPAESQPEATAAGEEQAAGAEGS